MIGVVRDTWRAVLVVVVAVLLREVFAERPAAPTVATSTWQPTPTVATGWPVQQIVVEQPQARPLRRIGEAFVDLGDAVIGAVRR
jgi:energy-converting hydrogenase Eha subunit A